MGSQRRSKAVHGLKEAARDTPRAQERPWVNMRQEEEKNRGERRVEGEDKERREKRRKGLWQDILEMSVIAEEKASWTSHDVSAAHL